MLFSKVGSWGCACRPDWALSLLKRLCCFPVFFELHSIVGVFRQLHQKPLPQKIECKNAKKYIKTLLNFFLGGGGLANDEGYDNYNRYDWVPTMYQPHLIHSATSSMILVFSHFTDEVRIKKLNNVFKDHRITERKSQDLSNLHLR